MSTETNHRLEFLLSEAPGQRSRENELLWGDVAPGTQYEPGTPLWFSFDGFGVISVSGSGDGSVSLGTLQHLVERGRYRLICVQEIPGGGVFSVESPSGTVLPNLVVGTNYMNAHLDVTVTAGTTNWALGDSITIQLNGHLRAANSGSMINASRVVGFCCDRVVSVNNNARAAVIVRDAEIDGRLIKWPAGSTQDQINRQIEYLKASGIIVR